MKRMLPLLGLLLVAGCSKEPAKPAFEVKLDFTISITNTDEKPLIVEAVKVNGDSDWSADTSYPRTIEKGNLGQFFLALATRVPEITFADIKTNRGTWRWRDGVLTKQ